jgi:hypothetical protein
MRAMALVFVMGLPVSTLQIAAAKDHGNKYRKHHEDEDRGRHRKFSEACFREEHIRVINEYYRPRSLPPGLERKLYRTGSLPPGWEKKIRPFPQTIETRLPPLCGGCARGYMDGYAVVYEPRSRVIIDFHAVLTP